MEYKYNLNYRYSLMPNSVSWNDLFSHASKFGIPRRTFQSDKSIKLNSPIDIPAQRLFKYAKIFNCKVTDLINYKIEAKAFRIKRKS